jgi:hypothetical protein
MLPGNAGAQVSGRPGLDVHTQRFHLSQRLFHHFLLQGKTKNHIILASVVALDPDP